MSKESEWLSRARGDMTMARLAMGADIDEAAAFHLQQAVEKGLKYLILRSGRRVDKTHDLEALAEQAMDPRLPFSNEELTQISLWALSGRYPDDDDAPPQRTLLEEMAERASVWLTALD
jgi:HEPN domain-containing protein